jgi:hypothetical protein
MKRIAFFIALFVGLNATAVARRHEDEAPHAIVQEYKPSMRTIQYQSLIHLISQGFSVCFYAITKEGFFHKINWLKSTGMYQVKKQAGTITRIMFNHTLKGDKESYHTKII